MEEVVETEQICDSSCQPPREDVVAETKAARPERQDFGNQPFKKLQNLDLF
jgi:hypothetical protein